MRSLGYERYGAQGGDFGASVTTYMALEEPAPLLGIHLHQIDDTPYTGPGSRPLSETEREYRERRAHWDATERGYSSIQSTKPQTVGYALNDSPAGLAAWIVEKWRSWSDSLENVDRDVLLTNLTIYWVSQTITALCATTTTNAGTARRSVRTTSSASRPPYPCSRTNTSPRARRRASGPSGSTTSGAGR